LRRSTNSIDLWADLFGNGGLDHRFEQAAKLAVASVLELQESSGFSCGFDIRTGKIVVQSVIKAPCLALRKFPLNESSAHPYIVDQGKKMFATQPLSR
jgi:hypothetical protein